VGKEGEADLDDDRENYTELMKKKNISKEEKKKKTCKKVAKWWLH
jgi:hypothetical protein